MSRDRSRSDYAKNMDHPDHTLLHSAVNSGNLEAAKLLLRKQVEIHFKNEEGMTPLSLLIQKRIELFNIIFANEKVEFINHELNVEEYERFNEQDAETDARFRMLRDVEQKRRRKFIREKQIFSSCMYKEVEDNERFIVMLLSHERFDSDCTEDIRLLKFHAACTLTKCDMAENLLETIADVNQSVNKDNTIWPGYTALHFAAYCNVNMVKTLINKGANLLINDAKGVTPLQICVESFSLEDIHSILSMISAYRNISFLGGKTKLLDYILSLHTVESHKKFLQKMGKKVGSCLLKKSLLWPGYTVAHIAVTLLSEPNIQIIQDILTDNSNLVTMQDVHGSTPIHLAFRQNKLKFLELLLKHQTTSANPLDKDSLSHLHIATSASNQELSREILNDEKNVNITYTGELLPSVEPGWTPLHTAVYIENVMVVIALLQKGADLLKEDAQGLTPIHILFSCPNDEIAELVFASDQLKECVANASGLTHLHVATCCNQPKAIERLLDLGSDIEAAIKLESGEVLSCRPSHLAIMSDSTTDAFEVLLQRGADIFAKKIDGSSVLTELLTSNYDTHFLRPMVDLIWNSKQLQKRCEKELGVKIIHLVCYTLDKDKLEKLLKTRVNVNARIRNDSSVWPGFSPLHALVYAGLEIKNEENMNLINEMCELLVSRGADITLTDVDGDTTILLALRTSLLNQGINCARMLMKHQVNFKVNPSNDTGMSHFHVSCLLNDVQACEKFLKENPKINVNQPISSDDSKFGGYTPLFLALSAVAMDYKTANNQLRMVDLLLAHGAKVDTVDSFGCTSLHIIACSDLTRIVLFGKLLTDNVNINKQSNNGITPMEQLLCSGAPSNEVYYLASRGARINGYNPISERGYMAIVLENNKYYNTIEASNIFKMMLDSPDITDVSDTGRNAIHNAVAAESTHFPMRFSCYGYILENLTMRGCDISQQDSEGRTALHVAVEFQNGEAIKALLDFGADVNIVDSSGKSPFSYATEFNSMICAIFTFHLRHLQIVGLQLSELNAKLLDVVLNERDDINIRIDEHLNEELNFVSKIRLCERGFTVRDFLYSTGPVNSYKSLSQADRDAVDLFFKSSNLIKFCRLRCFLKLQYRQALERSSLEPAATDALWRLLKFPLPAVWIHMTLKYFTNFDLKNITMAVRPNLRAQV